MIYSDVFHEAYNHPVCFMTFSRPSANATDSEVEAWLLKNGIYELLKCSFGFFLPLVIILCSYSAILYTVQWKLIGGSAGKQRATKLAAIIVSSFIIW